MTDQPLAQGMMRDLQGNVVPIPQGASQEPITQPQDDNMMTDLQGNRVPIPKGATQEPIQQTAPGSFQTKPGGPVLNANKDIPAPESNFYKKHPANVLYRDIRSNEPPEQIAARQQASKDVVSRIQNPVTTNDLMSDEQQQKHPMVAGTVDMATGMLTPENITLMAATDGLGTLTSPQAKLAADTISRLASGVFTGQQVWGAVRESHELWDAIKSGDESKALRLATHVIEGSAMASMGAQHAAGVEATPSTEIGKAIQAPVDRMNKAIATRLPQAFRSDANAMATANATHRAATAVFDQRINEHEMAVDQAVRASKAADEAKVKFTNGQITPKELDDANTAASKAAANANKATKALSDAHENLSIAGAEVDRMGRKIDRSRAKSTEKQDKAVAGALEDFKRMAPPTTTRQGQYSDKDLRIAMGYSEAEHQNEPIVTVQDHADALQKVSDDIDNEVGQHIQTYGKDPITTNVKMDVADKLRESPQVNFVHDGLNYLSDNFNLTDPSLEEAQKILTDMNALNRGVQKKNFWDVATALRSDPEFAARFYAADSLRSGIDGALVDRGVEGVREKRADQAAVIRVKTAVEKQVTKGGQRVRGSGSSGAMRLLAKGSAMAGAGIGAGIGAATGIPGGMEAGAMGGGYVGKKLGDKIAPGDLSRDELAARIHQTSGKGYNTTQLDDAGKPAGQYSAPAPVSPIMQMYTPQREMTPLHSALSTHYNEIVGKSSYNELEQRFMADMASKSAHNLPIEPDEKNILAQINDANMTDFIAAQKQMQDRNGAGKPTPSATLPENIDRNGLLHPPQSRLAEGMDTEKGIVHDLAHVVVGNEMGIKFNDGIGSHLHPDVGTGLMVAPIDWSPFMDEDGTINHDKLRAKLPQIAATYMAGGVANDLYHNIPLHENHHLGADVRILKGYLTDLGFSASEATKFIMQGADDAAQILSRPGVQQILEEHASVREAGLDSKYHVSPERTEQILEDVKGATSEYSTGKSTGPDATSKGPSEAVGARTEAKPKDGDSEGLRQPSKGPDEGKSSDVRKNESVSAEPEPKPARTKDVIGKVPEEFKPLTRPEGGWNNPTKIEPEYPKLDAAEDNEDLNMSELQSPRKRSYLMKVSDNTGDGYAQVDAFSNKDAIKQAQKKFPDATEWGVEGAKDIPASGEYKVPTGRHLSVRGSDPLGTMHHEHGHAMVGQNEGMKTLGMLRHTHPDMPSGVTAGVQWSNEGIVDPATHAIRPEKFDGVMRSLMGGVAADEAFRNIPRAENRNFTRIDVPYSDAGQAARFMKAAGYTDEQAQAAVHQYVDQAKQYLTNPHVSDIIKENAGTREPNLSRQYHYSPERLQSMHEEAQRRIQNGNPRIGGEGNQGSNGNVPGTEGGSPQAAKPEASTAAGQAPAITPDNPKFGGLNERTTGEPETDKTIKDAGAIPAGIMFPGTDYAIKMFHDPKTGSTLGFKPGETVSPEAVQQKLAESRQQFGIKPENPQLGKPELRVSARVPSGKDATEDVMGDNRLEIDRAALEKAPEKLQQKFADKIREVPGVKIPKNVQDIGKVYDRAIGQLSDHLKWLYNKETPENRVNNAKWYESAHNMTNKWAGDMGYKHEQVAGALASLSPQTEWDLNVSQAKRLIDIHKNHQDAVMGPNEMKTANNIIDRSRAGKNKTANEDLEEMLGDIKGKKIGELTGLPRAAAVRLYDEAHNPRTFNRIDPATGNEMEVRTNSDGSPTRAGWGNFSNMDKALSILDDGSRKNISDQVGDSHKVRNFYNNIIDPSHPRDVTMDTHAVGAATLTPMSGNTKEVTDNFGGAGKHAGTGVKGTYPLFAEAYRKAAGELGIKARELQSVTWEKVRDMFPAEWKTEDNMNRVRNEWKRYSDGKQSLDDTRQNISDMSDQGKKEAADRQAMADQKRQTKLDKQAAKGNNTPKAGLDALGGA
jgi:hypothetical protein